MFIECQCTKQCTKCTLNAAINTKIPHKLVLFYAMNAHTDRQTDRLNSCLCGACHNVKFCVSKELLSVAICMYLYTLYLYTQVLCTLF